jgi:hypothetical protein
MAPEWIYLLKVNVGIALFYAFYKLFCCKDTFFQWRRMALLSFLVIFLQEPRQTEGFAMRETPPSPLGRRQKRTVFSKKRAFLRGDLTFFSLRVIII